MNIPSVLVAYKTDLRAGYLKKEDQANPLVVVVVDLVVFTVLISHDKCKAKKN